MKPDELDPETRQKIVANLRTLSVSQEEVQDALATLHAKMHEEESAPQEGRVRQRQSYERTRPNWQRRLGLTVGVVAAAIASFFSWQARPELPLAQNASASSVYTTAKGERATITLPDGSTVHLNVASRLEVPADYLEGNRNVRLNGEAMFTVSHRLAAPFLVVSGPSTTRVLGTKFVVRHYATDSTAIVAVQDGKVSVDAVVLTAYEQIEVGRYRTPVVQRVGDGRFSFARGVLTLPVMPMNRAVDELSRWYDADIRVADVQLERRQIQGEFIAGDLADLARILELAFDLRVVHQGRTLILHSR